MTSRIEFLKSLQDAGLITIIGIEDETDTDNKENN